MPQRQAFENSLLGLQQDILHIGSLVQKAIALSVEALVNQDQELAQKVIEGDREIDDMEIQIEEECILLIATQQPMARDLRIVFTAIKILISLERMADHAVDIARVTMCLSGSPLSVKAFAYIPMIAGITQKMIREGLDAYVRSNAEQAKAMCALDDEVDCLFAMAFQELVSCMTENPQVVLQLSYLLFVIRYLERIADHATNIGEEVIYLTIGERKELN